MLAVLVVVLGCGGSARVVVRDTRGGLLTLEGDRGAARGEAERMMRAHCGDRGFEVTAEGDFTVRVDRVRTVTGAEGARRLADDQTDRTSGVTAGMSNSSVVTAGIGTHGEVDGPALYDAERAGGVPRLPEPVREHRLEYECRRTVDE